MPALTILALLAAAGMCFCVLGIVRPRGGGEVAGRAVVGAGAALAVSALLGAAEGSDERSFLLSASFAAAPVIILLGAAAEEVAPGRRSVARVLVGVWSVVVFPVALVVAPMLSRACGTPECRVEDFGAGLALFASSAAAVLLAGHAATRSPSTSPLRFLIAVLGLWVSTAVWLISLEGAIDEYTGRIALALLLSPLGGAIGWLVVDAVRRRRHAARSVADGVVAGLVAIVPGAATIGAPWSIVVGIIAGVVTALVYGARGLSRMGDAGHWALVVLSSTAVGFLAPAVAGDTIGLLVSGRVSALLPPVAEFAAVTALGVVASIPAWRLARRSARA